MDFEEWWAKQTANFDPEEIGLMQLARVTWHAAQDVEREACAKECDGLAGQGYCDGPGPRACAAAIRARSNATGEPGRTDHD